MIVGSLGNIEIVVLSGVGCDTIQKGLLNKSRGKDTVVYEQELIRYFGCILENAIKFVLGILKHYAKFTNMAVVELKGS